VILAVKFTPAGGAKAVRKAVGGFLRYVQYRDQHADSDPDGSQPASVSGLLKYVAYHDRATNQGRLFDAEGEVGDTERREFAAFVADAVASTRARPGPDGVDRRRAVYRFVLSPERAQGLDLRRLTLAAIGRLELEARASGLRWIAAEHRNTAHPHVHVVLSGFRENGRGGYQSLLITKGRLSAMKDELALEISRQRSPDGRSADRAERSAPGAAMPRRRRSRLPERRRRIVHQPAFIRLQTVAARYRRYLERELETELRRQEREREWSR
jgi:hypothetical protein